MQNDFVMPPPTEQQKSDVMLALKMLEQPLRILGASKIQEISGIEYAKEWFGTDEIKGESFLFKIK